MFYAEYLEFQKNIKNNISYFGQDLMNKIIETQVVIILHKYKWY